MEQTSRNLIAYRPQPGVMTERIVFLLKLKRGLDKNLDKTNLNAEIMAQEMEMSENALNHKLESILNQSICDFINQYRLQRAAEFLSAGYKVNEVSQRVGFKTTALFSQSFEEYYQKTPSAFLKESVDF
jgi:AraC-like DNA-binding protein